MKITKNKIKIVITFFLCIFFLILLNRIVENEIVKFDNLIYNLFHKTDALTNIMKFITIFGEGITIALFCIAALFIIKDKKEAWSVPINLIIISSVTQIIKFIVKRVRPIGINLIQIDGYSFPSGHTTAAVAFYGYLIYLIYKNCKNKKIKIVSILFLSILTFLIGISRIYLGVHYASDVLAGFFLSLAHLILYTIFVQKIVLNKKDKEIFI